MSHHHGGVGDYKKPTILAYIIILAVILIASKGF